VHACTSLRADDLRSVIKRLNPRLGLAGYAASEPLPAIAYLKALADKCGFPHLEVSPGVTVPPGEKSWCGFARALQRALTRTAPNPDQLRGTALVNLIGALDALATLTEVLGPVRALPTILAPLATLSPASERMVWVDPLEGRPPLPNWYTAEMFLYDIRK